MAKLNIKPDNALPAPDIVAGNALLTPDAVAGGGPLARKGEPKKGQNSHLCKLVEVGTQVEAFRN